MNRYADLHYDPHDEDDVDFWGGPERPPVGWRAREVLRGSLKAPLHAAPIADLARTKLVVRSPLVPVKSLHLPSNVSSRRNVEVAHIHPQSDSCSSDTTSSDTDSESESDSSLSQSSEVSFVSRAQSSRTQDQFNAVQLQNVELKKLVQALRNEANELRLQTSALKGEITGVKDLTDHVLSAAYERLLARVTSAPNTALQSSHFQPFFRIWQLAREANDRLFRYKKEDYVGQYYWTEDSFLDERQNGFFTATRDSQSGPIPFLIGENGIVVSSRHQEQMIRFSCLLFNTLRKYGMAPDAWEEIDFYALEWFCLSIRVRFVEFRLCDDHWKAETFASMGYSGWRHPHKPTPSQVDHEEGHRIPNPPVPHQKKAKKVDSKTRVESQPLQRQKEVQVEGKVARSTLSPSEDFSPNDISTSSSVGDCGETSESGDDADAFGGYVSPVIYDHNLDGFIEVSPRRRSTYPSRLPQRSPLRVRGEDPPDYVQLKFEERLRVDATSKFTDEKRKKLEILQGDPEWKTKPRANEKKQFHVHARRLAGNIISEQLDDFEWEKAEAVRRREEARTKPRIPPTKAAIRRRNKMRLEAQFHAEARARAETNAARREQEEWERRPDTRRRLDGLVKYVDHLERAYRRGERLLLVQEDARQQVAARTAFLAIHQARVERSQVARNEKLATKARLSRMLPQFALYQSMVMKQRMNEFRKKQALTIKILEEEKERRKQERRLREAQEAAARTEAARQKLEAQLREAEERLAAIRNQREMERAAAVEEARRKAQREAEAAAAERARLRAKRTAEAEERSAARRRVKEHTTVIGEVLKNAQPDVQAEERTQTRTIWRQSGASSHPPGTPFRPPVSVSSLPQTQNPVNLAPASHPAKYGPPGTPPGRSGWWQWHAEKQSVLPFQSSSTNNVNIEVIRPSKSPQVQTFSPPIASVPVSETDGGDYGVAAKKVWRPRRLSQAARPATSSETPESLWRPGGSSRR
ncbi:hypothetical protein HYDPIDRAFT_25765 [Hydnomerulius pinastri MD-312]|nr:hypothetical protein HYDPIDRAFT_25765 [Hydnomerulius pinastri MD-312]